MPRSGQHETHLGGSCPPSGMSNEKCALFQATCVGFCYSSSRKRTHGLHPQLQRAPALAPAPSGPTQMLPDFLFRNDVSACELTRRSQTTPCDLSLHLS